MLRPLILLFTFPLTLVHSNPVQSRCSNDCKSTQHWELLSRINLSSGVLPVYKYQSKRTGLTVVLAQADSPIVNGYFCLATEAWNNEGLPHTLEHLIFLGSEEYPYKEVLDLMANRCLADRTNAWTDTDHTCYTVYTAGSSGFLNILPIYLDHIFHPLLREQDFLTEVHHINEDGDDAGVVYSEMQGVENKPSNMIYFDLIRQIYPGNSSYTVQTGGALRNLREDTTIEKVRAYHKKFYRPENLYLTITGNVDPSQLFAALDPVEKKVEARKDEYPPFEKPFMAPLEDLVNDHSNTIQFPSDEEEDFGWVAMGWRIPGKLSENYPEIHALSILGNYMSSTSVSPLMKAFVEISEPMATDVDIDVLMNSESAITVDFENVPLDKIELIETKFVEILAEIQAEGLNMERLHTIIDRIVLARKMNVENSPHLVVPDPAVLDMLYAAKQDQLYDFITDDEEETAQGLIAKPESFWLDLMNATFSRPRVLTKAYPSQELSEELSYNETKRLELQKTRLGRKGLKRMEAKIKAALRSQILPPPEVLKSIPVADVNSIQFRKMTYFNYSTERQPEGFDLKSIPYHFHFDDMNSQFVRFYAFIDTSSVPLEDRSYLVLLTEMWLQSPLRMPNGTIESYDDVLQRRSEVTLSFYNDLGYKGSTFTPGSHSTLIMFFCEAQLSDYLEAVEVFRESLFDVEFDSEKADILISQLLNAIPSMKLSAASMNSVLFDSIFFNNQSIVHFSSVLRQQKFLANLNELLNDNPEVLIAKLQELRKKIVAPENIFVQMSTSLERLSKAHENPAEPWINLFGSEEVSSETFERLQERYPTSSEFYFIEPNPVVRHAIIGVPGTSSCYLKQSIPYDITDWEDQEVATMRVMLQYLSDRMYDQIRGEGLVYGISMSSSVTEGRTRVSFSRSSQLTEAYAKFRLILKNYTDPSLGDKNWDPDLLESAKGSQIYSWAEREETIEDLGSSSVKANLRNTMDPFYNRRFVKRLAKVTLGDVQSLALKYLPLFEDVEITRTAVTCGTNEVDDVTEFFQDEYQIKLEVIEDLDDSIFLTT